MSMGPMGASVVGSLSASPLAQKSAVDRQAQQATSNQARANDSVEQAEKAQGVGDPEESQKSDDRDADGRVPWKWRRRKHQPGEEEAQSDEEPTYHSEDEDDSGPVGLEIDLSG